MDLTVCEQQLAAAGAAAAGAETPPPNTEYFETDGLLDDFRFKAVPC